MGYTTDFNGSFGLNKPLTVAHLNYLTQFAETRRMKRDVTKLPADPVREAVDLPAGREGAYFVGGEGFAGQNHDASILDYNHAPSGQPGLWCQWVPDAGGEEIVWDGGEKFYDYVEWLKYIIDIFLGPWGYVLNGEVKWQGEESSDFGKIVVKNNVVTTKQGRKVYR